MQTEFYHKDLISVPYWKKLWLYWEVFYLKSPVWEELKSDLQLIIPRVYYDAVRAADSFKLILARREVARLEFARSIEDLNERNRV